MVNEREHQQLTKHSNNHVEEVSDSSQPVSMCYSLRNSGNSTSIAFFGSGPVAAASLGFLIEYFNIELVITKAIPSHHKGIAPVEELANKLHLPIVFASNKQELDNLIESRALQSQLGIIVDYGVIVSQKVIDSFKLGIINSHFSLLPQWRGADPITFSILSGQPKTGVSLMLIDSALDTGKLLAQKDINITDQETTLSLTKRLVELSNRLLLKFVPLYMEGKIEPKDQISPDKATYSRKLTKTDGLVDLRKPAEQIEREVRAYLGWPGSQINYKDKMIIIKKAHVTDSSNSLLDLRCGDGKYLSIDELIAPSGRTMSSKAFINGYA
jgi:methionyl-tRNA formyltransferase